MDLVPEEEGGNLFLVNGSMTPLRSAGAAYQTYDEELVRNFIKEIKIFPDKLTITVISGAHEDITINTLLSKYLLTALSGGGLWFSWR